MYIVHCIRKDKKKSLQNNYNCPKAILKYPVQQKYFKLTIIVFTGLHIKLTAILRHLNALKV